MNFSDYALKNTEELFQELKTSFKGLSKKEAFLRLEKYGPNEVKSKSGGWFKILKRQVKSPFIYLLFIASLISLAIGEFLDSGVIMFVVAANVAIGFFQEYRAEKAIFILKKFIPQNVKVLRNNKEQVIDKKDLVPGDIVILHPGDKAPADLRIIKASNLLIDESMLTGESSPVSKNSAVMEKSQSAPGIEMFEAKNIAFTGTPVVYGKAEGVVIATGRETVFGKIAQSILKEKYKLSTYEKDIFYFSKLVLKIVAITVILIFALGIAIKGYSHFWSFLLFSVALIISILPEGLPAVVSFALASGSIKMAKQNVVVRRLSAIERLGNIDILCTDKTGTLTKNKLALEKIVSSDKRKCLLFGLLGPNSGDRDEVILNPFDLALFEKSPDNFWQEYKKYSVVSELPFDSSRMRSSVVLKGKDNKLYLVAKGAPEIILDLCSYVSDGTLKKELKKDFAREGEDGKRVLAVAFKELKTGKEAKEKDEKNLIFLGYFVFEDPLKETAEEAIKLAKKMGVKIKIITGDSKEVAGYTARKIKLITNSKEVVSGSELSKMPPDEFDQACYDFNVFSRISPDLKYKIVKSLQKNYDVGFLGDGANDAPALRMADVGIAVAESSDISREVSDIVLLKRDLRVIVQGIENGRNIFANINKYIKCMLASNFGNFYSIAVISLFIDFLPMLPIQILLSNLLSDLPLVSIVTDKVDLDELKKPKAYHLRSVLPLIINLAIIITLADFAFFSIFYKHPPSTIQTLWFIESVFCELLLVFIIRTKHWFWKAEPPSFWLTFSIVSVFAATVALPFSSFGQKVIHFTAPKASELFLMVFILMSFMAASEFTKYLYFKYFRKKEERIVAQYVPEHPG